MGQVSEFPILQVVGYKNSGKTTLVQKVIRALAKEKKDIGVFKHHGHGGLPDISEEGTDTWKYRKAGACVTAVEGGGMFHFTSTMFEQIPPNKLIGFFQLLPLDGLILEGFKQLDYPKIVLVRTKEDLVLLNQVRNIKAIIYWYENLKQVPPLKIEQFLITEEEKYISYIVNWLKGEVV